MAETKNKSAESKGAGQALARSERESGQLQRRQAGSWLAGPFELVDRMAEEMDRTFDRMFRDFGLSRQSWLSRSPFRSHQRDGGWAPRVEASQKDDRFIVRADLPGLKKDDVQVELTDDAITI